MSARVITVFNQAGGVGKTTLVMNLGHELARSGERVLLVDIDPQASLTTFMGLEPVDLEQTIYDAVVGTSPLPLYPNIHSVTLAPSNLNLSAAELELVVADMRDLRLRDALKPVQQEFDIVLVDCPPSLGILTYISMVAADAVLVPVQTQFKAFQGTDLLLRTVARVRSRANRSLTVAGFVPTMFDVRNSQDKRTLEAIREQLSSVAPVYPALPRSTDFADASEARVPLRSYSPNHPALRVLEEAAAKLSAAVGA